MRSVRLFLASIVASAVLCPTTAQSQTTLYELGKTRWKARQWPGVVPPLRQHRQLAGGRTAEVDYMLGTSACRIAEQRVWGRRVLNYIRYNYPLPRWSREQILIEIQKCSVAAIDESISRDAYLTINHLSPGATASGKEWAFSGVSPVAAHPARQIGEFFGQPPVPLAEPARIEARLRRDAPAGARIKTVGRYAFVTQSGHSDAELGRIAALLDLYSNFLQREYRLQQPSHYITVYLAPNIRILRATALHVHLLEVSPSTLGYAYPEDLSVAGVVSGTRAGTLLHEMFHLMLRTTYGDFPQWLDEGLSALYEVSSNDGHAFVGLPNWRGRVLRDAISRPSLRAVITSPWFDYDGRQHEDQPFTEEIAAAGAPHMALARYFALYLQSQQLLGATVAAFRDRDPGAVDDPAEEAVRIVERIGGPLNQLERRFWTWFNSVDELDETSRPNVVTRTVPDER